ncbi:MAG: hypothetical protein KJP02_01750 [Octadecabacter sp.]|nr:hypothetical protein [Octadecabacter sp.]
MSVKITKHKFSYGGLGYFRTNAHLVELGSHGQKKDPIGAKAYIDPAGKIRASHLASRPIKISTVTIDWADVKSSDFDAGATLKFLGLGRKHGVSFDLADARSAKLKLMNFSIAENPLKRCLNNDADTVRRSMAEEGNDARLVGETWIAMEAELAEHIETNWSTGHSWEALGNSLDLTVSGGRHGSQTVTLGPGTCFAYKLYKVKKWSKGKESIEDLEADYKGMG